MRRAAPFLMALAVGLTALSGFAQTDEARNFILLEDQIYGHKAGMALTLDVIKPAFKSSSNGAGLINVVSEGFVSDYFDLEKAMADSKRSNGRLTTLTGKGYTIFVVRHGSSPHFTVPDAVADLRRAVRFIRHNAAEFGIDPNRIGVYGASAGGLLSLMLGTASDAGNASSDDPVERESDRVSAVVAYYPPTDLRGLVGPSNERPALDFDPALAESVSPMAQVSADDAPTLLVHGDKDETVPIGQSEQMHAALKTADVPTEFIVMPGAAHAFRGPDAQKAAGALTAWFDKYLAGK
jgi:acetyl esterase/lipase